MTKIKWDKSGERLFESGLDRGVLFPPKGVGVPWNGLISVVDKIDVTTEPLYFDGRKYNDLIIMGDFSAVMTAYTYPDEFAQLEGIVDLDNGLSLHNQTPSRFHLSYRTNLGNDVNGPDANYKIHILYNVLAVPSVRNYATISSNAEPVTFEWTLSSIPIDVAKHRPTEHIAFDTSKIDPLLITLIENIIYGHADYDPILPGLGFFINLAKNWAAHTSSFFYDLALTWGV